MAKVPGYIGEIPEPLVVNQSMTMNKNDEDGLKQLYDDVDWW